MENGTPVTSNGPFCNHPEPTAIVTVSTIEKLRKDAADSSLLRAKNALLAQQVEELEREIEMLNEVCEDHEKDLDEADYEQLLQLHELAEHDFEIERLKDEKLEMVKMITFQERALKVRDQMLATISEAAGNTIEPSLRLLKLADFSVLAKLTADAKALFAEKEAELKALKEEHEVARREHAFAPENRDMDEEEEG